MEDGRTRSPAKQVPDMLHRVPGNDPVALPPVTLSSAAPGGVALGGAAPPLLCSPDALQVWGMPGNTVTLVQAACAGISLPPPASCGGPGTLARGTAYQSLVGPVFSISLCSLGAPAALQSYHRVDELKEQRLDLECLLFWEWKKKGEEM